MRHLTLQQQSASIDQVLVGVAREMVRTHLSQCDLCRARHGRLVRRDEDLAVLLHDRPDEAWLEDSMLEVEALIEAEAGGVVGGPRLRPAPQPPKHEAEPAAAREALPAANHEAETAAHHMTEVPAALSMPEARPASSDSPAAPVLPANDLRNPGFLASLAAELSAALATPGEAPAGDRPATTSPAALPPAPVPHGPPLISTAASLPVSPPPGPPAIPTAASLPAAPPPAPPSIPAAASLPASLPPTPAPLSIAATLSTPPAQQSSPAPWQPMSPPPPPISNVPGQVEALTELEESGSPEFTGFPRSASEPRAPRRPEIAASRHGRSAARDQVRPLIAGLVGGLIAASFVAVAVLGSRSPHREANAPRPTSVSPSTPVEASGESIPPRAVPISNPLETSPVIAPPPVEAPRVIAPPPAPVVPSSRPERAVGEKPRRAEPAAATASEPAPTPVPRANVTVIPTSHSLVVTTSPRVAPAPAAAETTESPEDSWPLLCGAVLDRSGQPVVGARVEIADLHASARTDRRGRFCLAAPASDHTLAITAPGFTELRRPVSAREIGNQLSLVLDSKN